MENYVKNECEPNTADSYISVNNNYLKPILGHIPFKIISSPSGIDIINNYYRYLRFELQNEFKIDKRTGKKIPKEIFHTALLNIIKLKYQEFLLILLK